MFCSFRPLADKTNSEHLRNHFSRSYENRSCLFVCLLVCFSQFQAFTVGMERSEKQTYGTEKRAVLVFEPSILTKRLKRDSLFKEGYLREVHFRNY